ncbi:MAG: Gfo/Idh/MocA family oxidoreductase [Candidatus Omnitrophica bacterium]|nr:Gfo/Idh/MocA family oxidoreductase [Candidatus Omnitrophota bacterium]
MKIAVLGTGSIGLRHLGLLRTIDGARPIAIPIRASRRSELRALGYETAEDLAAAAALGASLCLVATDTGRHETDSREALQRGFDLLVEKPVATDAEAALRVLERARALQRRVFVGCVVRFSESLKTFRQRLADVGEAHAVRIECQSYLPSWRPDRPHQNSYSARAEEGGVLRDLIHEIDYAGWIFGWPVALSARLRNTGRLGIAAEEMAELMWETPAGASVSVALDYLTQPPRRRMRVSGSRGTIEWDGMEQTVTVDFPGGSRTTVPSSQTRDAMIREELLAWLNARHGVVDERLATAEEGLRALAVCDAARQASDAHREATVEERWPVPLSA